MDSLIYSLNAVLPLFILVSTGYVLKRIGVFTDEWLKTANTFSFRFTFFVLLFYDVYTADTSAKVNPKFIAFAVGGILAITVLCYLTIPFTVKDRFRTGVVIQGIYRSNFVLFGMPLVLNMFGKSGRPVVAVLVAIIIPIYNIIAVITLSLFNKNSSGNIDVKKLLKSIVTNPLILGCLFGFVFKYMKIPMPTFMFNSLEQIASIALPLALIFLGGQFKFMGFIKNIKTIITVISIKQILVPTVMLIIAILSGFRGLELGILISIFASPGAVSSSIMAYNMDCDGDLAGQLVVFGTLVSVFTIFIAVFILKSSALL